MSTFACMNENLRNLATVDRSQIDFQLGIDVDEKGTCKVELEEMMLEHQQANIQREVDVPFFEPHFRTDPYPENKN